MITSTCKWCGCAVTRGGSKPGRFCSLLCKGEWQRTQKPVSKEWLHQKYIVEGLSTYEIGNLVNRDAKRVYEWLVDYGIETRKRKWSTKASGKPFQSEDWLREQYVLLNRSAGEISEQFGVTEQSIYFWMKRFGIERRTTSEARDTKHWGESGEANPMFGKRGSEVPGWKGGCTPERQAFYSSVEWANAVKVVWKRDNATCQRCGCMKRDSDESFHIHHIVSFAVKELRAEPSNLVLLCAKCHRFIHSKGNVNKDFLG